MIHFIPLPKLPLAKETAEVMFLHMFRFHGVPRDIVSDRGLQFVSQFWQTFDLLLGATASLPQVITHSPAVNGAFKLSRGHQPLSLPRSPAPGVNNPISPCPGPPLLPYMGHSLMLSNAPFVPV